MKGLEANLQVSSQQSTRAAAIIYSLLAPHCAALSLDSRGRRTAHGQSTSEPLCVSLLATYGPSAFQPWYCWDLHYIYSPFTLGDDNHEWWSVATDKSLSHRALL